MAVVAKSKTNDNLRHNEYYDLQNTFDELYAQAKEGQTFDDLMSLILSKENIRLAFRNIKANKGSMTPGTDGQTIDNIKNLSVDEVVEKVNFEINRNQGYRPKPVRRKEIPKPNGKTRPLGIPCIWDRLIQQCIKQVMEPICEAKFNPHSYGFRPGRKVEHAIAEIESRLSMSKTYFIVEFDIEGFFDNVDHRKLLKQIWALRIHDKKLLYVIGQILKAPIMMPSGEMQMPKTGTPQGGILSPLLANIVLNELDWWVTSQWENHPVTEKYVTQTNVSGGPRKSNAFTAMKKTKLKEMRIIRYADDFRILCRTKSQAQKAKIAVTQWLKERLKLNISQEKTKIVNAKRQYSEFLGFKIKVAPKRGKYVTRSHICNKKKQTITTSLKEQAKRIARAGNAKEALTAVHKFNSMVAGIQNYFQIATCVNLDCKAIAYKVNRVLFNRLSGRQGKKGRISKHMADGRPLTNFEVERYGKSKMLRFDKACKSPIYPIGYIRTRSPLCIKFGLTPYTVKGREMMHKSLGINVDMMLDLMAKPTYGTIEYADNRISLYCAQWGKDAVTGQPFESADEIHCHHKIPKKDGGTDAYQNLVLISETIHRLIHAKKEETIQRYMSEVMPDKTALRKINKLRKMAQLPSIKS